MKISIAVISKDELKLDETLTALEQLVANRNTADGDVEVLVVDASSGRLRAVADAHPDVRWVDFVRPEGVRVSIPHQRNRGVAEALGDIIVFTDAGCVPEPEWLQRLVGPIQSGAETVTAGPAMVTGSVYEQPTGKADKGLYLTEAPTINLAFTRQVFDQVGGFDEYFEYGSDLDFTWRLVAAGERIRWVGDAVVSHDWGDSKRQLRRSYVYGVARARLYRRHPARLKRIILDDPVPVAYPLFILGLPLTLKWRWYPLLLLVGLWRNRKYPRPAQVLVDHLAQGTGVLFELSGIHERRQL